MVLDYRSKFFFSSVRFLKKSMTCIKSDLWWVVEGKLAGVRKPENEEIKKLKEVGIGGIVSMMDDPSNLDKYQEVGLAYKWLPTTGGCPPSVEHMKELKQFIDEQNALGSAVAVHCSSGRRRTGTSLAAYFILSGSSCDDALRKVLGANPNADLREEQVKFLNQLGNL